MTPRITVCVPIYGRPQRTCRIIDCLQKQTINNIQVYLIGDGCPQWQADLDDGWPSLMCKKQEALGNEYIAINLEKNYGGYGYHIRNMMKELADAPFLCFIDNDDWVKPNHLEHYLSEIEHSHLEFVYYNTWNNALGILRDTQPTQGLIGHSELCIRTSFFQEIPEQGAEYGHDWEMIQWMLKSTTQHQKAKNPEWSYKVMGTPAKRETDID